MRERELKRVMILFSAKLLVAPHAGARIETSKNDQTMPSPIVAPHAGARIETSVVERRI